MMDQWMAPSPGLFSSSFGFAFFLSFDPFEQESGQRNGWNINGTKRDRIVSIIFYCILMMYFEFRPFTIISGSNIYVFCRFDLKEKMCFVMTEGLRARISILFNVMRCKTQKS